MAATVTSPPTGPPGALLTTTPATASKPAPHWPQPSHPDLITLARGADRFSERAVAASSHPAGAVLASLSAATPAARRTWATVQAGPGGAGDDVDLNSDWVYCNHSCEPSLVFDMRAREVRVVEARPLKEGDDMTFFYPSTEFDMAQVCDFLSCVLVGEAGKGARERTSTGRSPCRLAREGTC